MDWNEFEKVELPSRVATEAGDWSQACPSSPDVQLKGNGSAVRIGLLKMVDIADLETLAGAVWRKDPSKCGNEDVASSVKGGIENIH